jgi:hypothetical protein
VFIRKRFSSELILDKATRLVRIEEVPRETDARVQTGELASAPDPIKFERALAISFH